MGSIFLALVVAVVLRLSAVEVVGWELRQRVQAEQDETLLVAEEAVLAAHCSLAVEEAEVMSPVSSAAVEEALKECSAQGAEVARGRDLEVEVVLLKELGCL